MENNFLLLSGLPIARILKRRLLMNFRITLKLFYETE